MSVASVAGRSLTDSGMPFPPARPHSSKCQASPLYSALHDGHSWARRAAADVGHSVQLLCRRVRGRGLSGRGSNQLSGADQPHRPGAAAGPFLRISLAGLTEHPLQVRRDPLLVPTLARTLGDLTVDQRHASQSDTGEGQNQTAPTAAATSPTPLAFAGVRRRSLAFAELQKLPRQHLTPRTDPGLAGLVRTDHDHQLEDDPTVARVGCRCRPRPTARRIRSPS